VQPLGSRDGLVAGDDPAAAINQDGAAGAVLAEGSLERFTSAVSPAVRVLGIGDEVSETDARPSRLHE
jgi:hypothetical protein